MERVAASTHTDTNGLVERSGERGQRVKEMREGSGLARHNRGCVRFEMGLARSSATGVVGGVC